MIEHEAEISKEKPFIPDDRLVSYMQKRLKTTKQMNTLRAGGHKLSKEIKKQDNSLSASQNRILNKFVFPSMANLYYFFGMVSKYPELQHSLDKHIKDLLGVKRDNPTIGNYGYIFSELIASILLIKPPYEKRNKEDFRLRLLNVLQEIILFGVQKWLPEILKSEERYRLMENDMIRWAAWISILAFNVKDEYDLKNKEQLEEDIKNKSPHRVFSFDY